MCRAYLRGRVLVALDLAQRLVSGIEDELRRVVAEETLAHVDDGLDGRGLSGLIDNRPDRRANPSAKNPPNPTQTVP